MQFAKVILMKSLSIKHLTMISILPTILILAGVILFMMTYWPSGITVDNDNNINLGVVLGKGNKIPADEITVSEVPEGLLSHLIRTNGRSLGKIKYGKFKTTQARRTKSALNMMEFCML